MSQITITVPHSLEPADLLARAEPALEAMVDEFHGTNLEVTKTDQVTAFKFNALLWTIQGTAEALPQSVLIKLDLPLAALAFQNQIAAAIKKSLGDALA